MMLLKSVLVAEGIIEDLETGVFDKRFSYVFDVKKLRKKENREQ